MPLQDMAPTRTGATSSWFFLMQERYEMIRRLPFLYQIYNFYNSVKRKIIRVEKELFF
jgi:hypothetical protein